MGLSFSHAHPCIHQLAVKPALDSLVKQFYDLAEKNNEIEVLCPGARALLCATPLDHPLIPVDVHVFGLASYSCVVSQTVCWALERELKKIRPRQPAQAQPEEAQA